MQERLFELDTSRLRADRRGRIAHDFFFGEERDALATALREQGATTDRFAIRLEQLDRRLEQTFGRFAVSVNTFGNDVRDYTLAHQRY